MHPDLTRRNGVARRIPPRKTRISNQCRRASRATSGSGSGAAAKEWLAGREAELLPVGYFHLVFTLPGPIADIAYHN